MTLPSNVEDYLSSGKDLTHTLFFTDEKDWNPNRKKTVVLYHENCWDGLGAAWSAKQCLGNSAEYIPVNYNRPLPNLKWSDLNDVFIVDFSYPSEVLDEVYAVVKGNLLVLDHHATAEAQLKGKPYAVFNMNMSGAGMSWMYFADGALLPQVKRSKHKAFRALDQGMHGHMPEHIYYIQDYDLWKFEDKNTKGFRAALDMLPREIKTLDLIHSARVNDTSKYNATNLVRQGKVLVEYKQKLVEEAAKNAFLVRIPGFESYTGYAVLCSNPSLTSELGNFLAKKSYAAGGEAFSVVFSVNAKSILEGKVTLSLRSLYHFDVSMVAKKYGGGGHAQASGCSWDYAFFCQYLSYLGLAQIE